LSFPAEPVGSSEAALPPTLEAALSPTTEAALPTTSEAALPPKSLSIVGRTSLSIVNIALGALWWVLLVFPAGLKGKSEKRARKLENRKISTPSGSLLFTLKVDRSILQSCIL
jgi:hypothetical protein